jgi:hypothetical protein
MIGKPDSGELNVRFDEGELEIGPSPLRQLSTLPILHRQKSAGGKWKGLRASQLSQQRPPSLEIAERLSDLGHDAKTINDQRLQGVNDRVLLERCDKEKRTLVMLCLLLGANV